MTRAILTAFLALSCFFFLCIHTNFLFLLPAIIWRLLGVLFIDMPRVVRAVVEAMIRAY